MTSLNKSLVFVLKKGDITEDILIYLMEIGIISGYSSLLSIPTFIRKELRIIIDEGSAPKKTATKILRCLVDCYIIYVSFKDIPKFVHEKIAEMVKEAKK